MNIKLNEKPFGDLAPGEIFWHCGVGWTKIASVKQVETNEEYNAVSGGAFINIDHAHSVDVMKRMSLEECPSGVLFCHWSLGTLGVYVKIGSRYGDNTFQVFRLLLKDCCREDSRLLRMPGSEQVAIFSGWVE
jgi:hypothetical protein